MRNRDRRPRSAEEKWALAIIFGLMIITIAFSLLAPLLRHHHH